MKHPESQLQIACVKWFRYQHASRLILAVPNGGKRNRIEAAIMQAEGVCAGVPDLFIPEPFENYHGLWIEMKFGKNTPTESQEDWHRDLRVRGYAVAICWTIDGFMNAVNDYFKFNPKDNLWKNTK